MFCEHKDLTIINDDMRWLSIMINESIYKYVYYTMILLMMRCHEDTVMLHNNTGSYGQPMIEVAYGGTMIHSTEAVVVGV